MSKKFYVFLILIVLIIIPFFLQGAERASISPDKLKIEPAESFLPTKDHCYVKQWLQRKSSTRY